jgi:uncharacterized protein YggE
MSSRIRRHAKPAILVGITFVLALVFATTRYTAAQESTTVTTTEPVPTTLTVTGQGTVVVEPDTASVSFGVTIEDETLTTAQTEATETMTAILAVVTDAGVAERDVQTVDFSVTIQYDYDDEGNVTSILGYQVSNTINVTVRQLDALGGILDAVVARGANNVYGVSFFVNDTKAAASQARIAAVEDATAKANDIAGAAGLRVSRIVSINEETTAPPTPVDFYPAAEMDDSAAGAAVPVQAGTTDIMATVYMVFELEPAE